MTRAWHTPLGTFRLQRYPARRNDPLQPFASADALLLEQLQHDPGAVLVVNDEQGALCTPLDAPTLWTDSAMAALAVQCNRELNDREPATLLWSTEPPPAADTVLMRVPKQLPYFEYQLRALAAAMPAGGVVHAAGMDKHLSPRTADLLEEHIGPTTRHRGQRKARVFTAVRDGRPAQPQPVAASVRVDGLPEPLYAAANVFSREQLDIGTRFLLANLHRLQPVERAIDLACGNGVLGLAAFQRGLATRLLFADESAMAIDSARRNARVLSGDADFTFHHGDGLLAYSGPEADLVLCNPPFHLQHVVDEFAGRRLIGQAAAQLAPGGALCLVANRHLKYGAGLGRRFESVEVLAENRKFRVWLACKASG